MVRLLNPAVRSQRPQVNLNNIVNHIAISMVGRAVDLLVGTDQTAHGIVTAVQFEAGMPKIVVGGASYTLDQVLTAVPPTLN